MMFTKTNTLKVAGKTTLILSAFAFASLTSAATEKPANDNFTGQWKLNEQKSELGQFGARLAAKTMKLTSYNDSLNINRVVTGPDGEMTMSETVSFDGKTTETTILGGMQKKSTAKWSEDGKTLTVTSALSMERDGQSININVSEKWKLVDDGKSLLIETSSTSPWGNTEMKLMYTKS